MRFKKILIALILISALISCSKDSNDSNSNNSITERILLKSNTNKVSETFYKLGVEEIKVEKRNLEIVYNTNVVYQTVLNGHKLDFSHLSFSLNDDKLSIVNDSEYFLSLRNNQLYIESPKYTGFLKDGSNNKLIDYKSAALLLFYKEISTQISNIEKRSHAEFFAIDNNIDFKTLENSSNLQKIYEAHGKRHCGSNWAVDTGFSRSSLTQELTDELASTHFYDGCTKVGGMDVSCVTDNHICVATQKYYCPCD